MKEIIVNKTLNQDNIVSLVYLNQTPSQSDIKTLVGQMEARDYRPLFFDEAVDVLTHKDTQRLRRSKILTGSALITGYDFSDKKPALIQIIAHVSTLLTSTDFYRTSRDAHTPVRLPQQELERLIALEGNGVYVLKNEDYSSPHAVTDLDAVLLQPHVLPLFNDNEAAARDYLTRYRRKSYTPVAIPPHEDTALLTMSRRRYNNQLVSYLNGRTHAPGIVRPHKSDYLGPVGRLLTIDPVTSYFRIGAQLFSPYGSMFQSNQGAEGIGFIVRDKKLE